MLGVAIFVVETTYVELLDTTGSWFKERGASEKLGFSVNVRQLGEKDSRSTFLNYAMAVN